MKKYLAEMVGTFVLTFLGCKTASFGLVALTP